MLQIYQDAPDHFANPGAAWFTRQDNRVAPFTESLIEQACLGAFAATFYSFKRNK